MRPTILKLLNQEPVTKAEWHDLFFSVHVVCVWDERDIAKLQEALKEDIMDFIKHTQQVQDIIIRCKKYRLKQMKGDYCFVHFVESFST